MVIQIIVKVIGGLITSRTYTGRQFSSSRIVHRTPSCIHVFLLTSVAASMLTTGEAYKVRSQNIVLPARNNIKLCPEKVRRTNPLGSFSLGLA